MAQHDGDRAAGLSVLRDRYDPTTCNHRGRDASDLGVQIASKRCPRVMEPRDAMGLEDSPRACISPRIASMNLSPGATRFTEPFGRAERAPTRACKRPDSLLIGRLQVD